MAVELTIDSFNKESSAFDFSAYYDFEPSAESQAFIHQYNIEQFDRPTARSRQNRSNRSSINGAVKRTVATARTREVTAGTARARSDARTEAGKRIGTGVIIRGAALLALAAFVITMLVVSQVQSHELTRSIQEKQAELVELQQQYDIMMDKFNTEMSDSAVEEYAAEHFGMIRCESSQTEYVSLDSDEYFEFGTETKSNWTTCADGN